MKQIAAILFFSILAFNWFGYRIVINCFEQSNNQRVEAKLDSKDYKDAELISIKAPFSLPYFYNNNNPGKYERWSGEFEINGTTYKYVKRRFFKDSVELLCLPDYKATKLQSAKNIFFRFTNDIQQENQNKKSGHTLVYKSLNDFCHQNEEWSFATNKIALLHYSFYVLKHTQSLADNKGQPPDYSC
ncbi:MAG: hypothetical protein JWN76_776 [Chitinophagaceae bacterium]|nr:hypothetical protein [Chitinophagaceae bacterium]